MEVCESESLLAGWNMPSSTLASKNWELFCQKARHILVVFLLSYQDERKKKVTKIKRNSYTSVSVTVLQRNPFVVILPKKEPELPLFDPKQKNTPLPLFILHF